MLHVVLSLFLFNRSQIKQTLKKKAFEEAGIPVKQISLIQVQSPPPPPVTPTVAPTLITSTVIQPDDTQITQIDEEMVYIKSEVTPQPPQQIISSMPSTSTATLILPAPSELPHELIESNVKEEEEIQIGGENDELNLLGHADAALLSTLNVPPPQPTSADGTDDSIESTEIKMDEITSG